MEENEIQTEQEVQKELTVDDLETIAGGSDAGSETDEIGDPVNGAKGVKSEA